MRVLIVHPGPEFSVADVYRGWKEALEFLGCEVALYNTNDRLYFYSRALIDTEQKDEFGLPIVRQALNREEAITASMQGITHACYTFWPDVVLFVSGFFVTNGVMALLRQRGHKVVILHTESPYQETEQLGRAPFADINILNDPCNIADYEAIDGTTAMYLPHCYRPELHHQLAKAPNPNMTADLCFIGTAFDSRVRFFEELVTSPSFGSTDFLLGGSYWDDEHMGKGSPLWKYVSQEAKCVDNTETAEVYQNSTCGLNLYRRESEDEHQGEGWAMGPREVEMAASGLFFLRDPRGEGDEVLHMLPTFSSPGEASDKLRWWLEHEAERKEAALQALIAIADRTFTGNARKLLLALESLD